MKVTAYYHQHVCMKTYTYNGVRLWILVIILSAVIGCSHEEVSHDFESRLSPSGNGAMQRATWERWTIPTQSSAHLWRDTLTVAVKMRNTTGHDFILLPSLLYVNIVDSTSFVPSYDAMGVMFYGMKQHWRAGAGDNVTFYDAQYLLQILSFPNDSSLTITYKVPMDLFPARKLNGIRYMLGLEFPVWNARDSIVKRIAKYAMDGSEFQFTSVQIPDSGNHFRDWFVINLGTESWRDAIHISKKYFYEMGSSKAGNVGDASVQSMMVVSKGPVQPRSPKHVTPAYIINEEVNKAAARAEREARP